MLTPRAAQEQLHKMCDEYAGTRRYYDAAWAMSILYDAGRQWGSIADTSGNLAVQCLPEALGEGRTTRLTLNQTHRHVQKTVANTDPVNVAASPVGANNITTSYVRAASRVMDHAAERVEAVDRLCECNLARTILGSAGIRLVLKQRTRAPAGGGGNFGLRTWQVDWANFMPWEIIRESSSKSLRPARDDDRIAHQKPRSLVWLQEAYGWTPKPDQVRGTMGELLDFQDKLMSAQGYGGMAAPTLKESKAKAVLVHEAYFKDPEQSQKIFVETGLWEEWPWMYVGWSDPNASRSDILAMPNVGTNGLVRNPFCTNPLFVFHFDRTIEAMWARSLPWLLMQGQDISNIAVSWMVEAMQQCFPKWRLEKGTVENPAKALNNNPRRWIEYKRVGNSREVTPPDRIPGVNIPPAAREMAEFAPEWMAKAAGIAPVQEGRGYKRDGSGVAYEALIREAESIPENRISHDEREIARLLYATTVDSIRWSTIDQLRAMLGPEVPYEHVLMLKRDDPRMRLSKVTVHPAMLRPKTKAQTEEHFVNLVERQVLLPGEAVLEILLQSGTALNTAMRQAFEVQAYEIDQMLQGQFAEPTVWDEHPHHLTACKNLINSLRWIDVPPEAQELILLHATLHADAIQDTTPEALGLRTEGQGSGQPSPSAQATAAGSRQTAAGSVGPALNL